MTTSLDRTNRKLDEYFGMLVLVACGIALALPQPFAPLAAWSSAFLFYNIAATSLAASFRQFGAILRSPLPLILSFLIIYGLLPVVAYLISVPLGGIFGEMAVGFILLMCLPSGIMSAVWTGIARGRVPLAITVVSFTTLFSFLITPLLVQVYAGVFVEFNPNLVARTMLWTITVPVLLGTSINTFWSSRIAPARVPLRIGVKLSVMLIVLGNVAVLRDRFGDISPWQIIGLVVVMAFLGIAGHLAGYVVGRATVGDLRSTIALTFAGGLRNHVIGIILATTYLTPLANVPIIISMLVLPPIAGLIGTRLRPGTELSPSD